MASSAIQSLDELAALADSERMTQVGQFQALDTKAGIALGFAGALVALAPDVGAFGAVGGVVAASLAAAFALLTFLPRRFELFDLARARAAYLGQPSHVTRLALLDTTIAIVENNRRLLDRKARRLKWALASLLGSASLFAAGTVWDRGKELLR